MKIGGRKNVNLGSIGPMHAPAGNSVQSTEAPVAQSRSDRIEITSASQIATLRQALGAIPDIRTEMIEGIRLSVEDGTYYIESDQIAKRVVDDALAEALQRNSRS